jgi:hypothetical protein
MLTLFDELDASYLEHLRCGEDGGVEGECVWMTCKGCGAVVSRSVLLGSMISRGES